MRQPYRTEHEARDRPDRSVAELQAGSGLAPEVRAGQEFRITVTTVGASCTTAEGGDVRVVEHLARVVPYDREPRPGHEFCAERMLTVLPRELRVTLVRAGTAQLRVVGLKATTREAELDSLNVAVTVLP